MVAQVRGKKFNLRSVDKKLNGTDFVTIFKLVFNIWLIFNVLLLN